MGAPAGTGTIASFIAPVTFELAGAAADATDGAFIMDVAFPLTGAAADVVAAAALELVEATVEVVFDTAKNSRGFEASASRRAA